MKRLFRQTVAIVLVGLVQTGCGSSELPVAPTLPPVPSMVERYIAGDRWNLLATYRGHTGPEACLSPFDGNPGAPTPYVLIVKRYGATIHLQTEHNHYLGTTNGDQFLARENDDVGSTWTCGNKALRFRREDQVSGQMSADGQLLTGEEISVTFLESGETVRRYWDWTATRG
jgi:hypothetical protein